MVEIKKLSKYCCHFLKQCLNVDTDDRACANDLLDHRFIRYHVISRINNYDFRGSIIIKNISEFDKKWLIPNLIGVFCEL